MNTGIERIVTTRFTGSDVARWRRRVGAGKAAKSGAGISAAKAPRFAGSLSCERYA